MFIQDCGFIIKTTKQRYQNFFLLTICLGSNGMIRIKPFDEELSIIMVYKNCSAEENECYASLHIVHKIMFQITNINISKQAFFIFYN